MIYYSLLRFNCGLYLLELIFAGVLVLVCFHILWLRNPSYELNTHNWKELHANLEIGRHKSSGLESNLIEGFIERINASLGVLTRKRFQLINLELGVSWLERVINITWEFLRSNGNNKWMNKWIGCLKGLRRIRNPDTVFISACYLIVLLLVFVNFSCCWLNLL